MSSARVVLGMPLFNHGSHLPEAIESLLTQRFHDFVLVAIDDHSTDETLDILQRYKSRERRIIHVERNPRRLGMIGNFNRTLALGRELCSDAQYFAWTSDHDIWHPFWLEALVEALDSDPTAVLAYPCHIKVAEGGEPLGVGGWRFDTADARNRRRRFRTTIWSMSAGNMIYGLYRIDALERAGGKRRTLLPDRMLMSELALHGRFRQVPELLWYRRHFRGLFSVERQRRSLFGPRRPWWVRVPWWVLHPTVMAWALAVRGEGVPKVGRLAGLTYAVECGILSLSVHLYRGYRRLRKRHLPRLYRLLKGRRAWARARR